MTTELEKQFFDTFGIEPTPNGKSCIMCCHRKYDLISLIGSCTLKTTYDKCDFAEKHYPQITDRHYLELICILCKRDYDLGCCWFAISGNVEELKNYLLGDCIEYVSDIKHQVKELFKENK